MIGSFTPARAGQRTVRTGLMALLMASTAFTGATSALAQDDEDRELHGLHWDEIVVTASPLRRTTVETILGTTVLDEEEIAQRIAGTIGETLRQQPGVSSSFFGPGASRPIIRGLAGPRIRVLDSGIGSIDASVTSDDHAVAIDPALATRIEVVRGTGMLRYGSSAAGGVVNIFDGRIPMETAEGGFDLGARYAYSTVDNGNEFAGALNADVIEFGGGTLVFHADGFWRETENYDIPGFSESAALRALEEEEHGDEEGEEHDEEDEAFGTVENSDTRAKGGSGGVSWVFENGFIGVSGRVQSFNYGIPGGHAHEEGEEHGEEEGEEHEEEEEEEIIRIDLDQVRLDFHSEVRGDFWLFDTATFRVGYADYEHAELEGSEIGTTFENEGVEGRVEFLQKAYNGLEGAVGVQYIFRDFSAIGEEAFVPPTETNQFGIFTVQELDLGLWRLELGGRYERTNHEVTETGLERDFDALSVSGGVAFTPYDNLFLGATLFRTERAPATEELFSNGPHLATNAFEIGNPNLDKETALGIEATARGRIGWLSAQINGFYTDYSDFIFLSQTGEIEDGLPVFLFVAEDATFRGFEAQAQVDFGSYDVYDWTTVDFYLDGQLDFVRATTDASGNDNLPRIPPLSALFGIGMRSEFVDFRAELEYVAEQDEIADFELPTDDYTFVNLFATIRPFGEARNIAFDIRASNLTDEEARVHSSFLKDLIPLPGRNVRIAVRTQF